MQHVYVTLLSIGLSHFTPSSMSLQSSPYSSNTILLQVTGLCHSTLFSSYLVYFLATGLHLILSATSAPFFLFSSCFILLLATCLRHFLCTLLISSYSKATDLCCSSLYSSYSSQEVCAILFSTLLVSSYF